MGQRVIVSQGKEVRIVEAGPPGPRGYPGQNAEGSGSGGSSSNEVSNVNILIDANSVDDVGNLIMAPTSYLIGVFLAIINAGTMSGIYEGQAVESNGSTQPYPMVKRGPLPDKAIFSTLIGEEEGPWVTLYLSDEWALPVLISGGSEAPSGGASTGYHIIDLRAENYVPIPPGWSEDGGPSGEVIWEGFDQLYSDDSEPLQFFLVDFASLPEDKNTLIVILPQGRWVLAPTSWPEQDRGSWILNVVFDGTDYGSNLVNLGLTLDELLSWGFFPSNSDVTIEYHSTWGV